MWAEHHLTAEEWEQFWGEVVDAVDEPMKAQLKEWYKQRQGDYQKRFIRRILTF